MMAAFQDREIAVSLKSIANQLQVSESLVSKVLSGKLGTSGASLGTVQAIRAKARELGYRQNRTAAALARGRHDVIAVFLHQLGTPASGIVENLVNGITATAARRRQRPWLNFFLTDEEFEHQVSQLSTNDADGLIVGGVTHRKLVPRLRAMQDAGLPVVTIHERPVHRDLVNVGADQHVLLECSTGHLLDRGCRRLAHVEVNAERREGFERAHDTRGLKPDQRLIIHTCDGFAYRSGVDAAARLMDAGLDFDGVVTQSDEQALGVLHELRRRGVAVPEQVKIIGVDNAPFGAIAEVPLSSVSEDYRGRAEAAVHLLMDLIDGRSRDSVVVPPILTVRQSSA